ncbi:MAG: glucose 1-dehydrogenase [Pseudomonadota bacterium]
MEPVKSDRKAALVTGCASGIGAATCAVFAAHGVDLVGVDLDAEAGEHVIAAARDAGVDARFHRGDVSVEADVEAAVELCASAFGRLDMAVNNAGIEGVLQPIAETKAEDFDRVIAVNLRGVFLCMKHELRLMAQGGRGAIVNNASVMGLVGAPQINQYVAAKHGVLGLTKSAAAEYASRPIRINAICPGAVETRLVKAVLAEQPDALKPVIDAIPAQRMAQPEEIAAVILWLCDGAPPYLTGACLPVDGAYVAV